MKIITFIALGLLSFTATAKDITLKVDLSRHLKVLSSVRLELSYVSTSTAVGCQTYSGDILDPLRPIYIEKSLSLGSDGVINQVIKSKLSRCNAKLISIDLKLRLDRQAVASANNARKSDVDKNRIDFNFFVFEAQEGQEIRDSKLNISKLYVAGSDDLKYTLSCSFEAAPIIDDAIILSL